MGEIFIVDDDPNIRECLALAFRLEGYEVAGFPEGTALLAAAHMRMPTCILLDVDMPGRSGLEVLKELNARDYPAPVIMISGKSQIATAVDAIRNGALDFIEKPFEPRTVVLQIGQLLGRLDCEREQRTRFGELPPHFPGAELLTRRECEVLARIATGETSKAAGRNLGISSRTVDVHRARIMQKLRARNAADLMRIVLSEHRHH